MSSKILSSIVTINAFVVLFAFMKRNTFIARILHKAFLWMAFLFTVLTFGLFQYESRQTFEDYIEYFHVTPYKADFDIGDDIEFYSFYDSHKEVDIAWNAIVWCDAGNGYEHVRTANTGAEDFKVDRKYPDSIRKLLIKIKNSAYPAALEEETLLRNYAESTQNPEFTGGSRINKWKLAIDKPSNGSQCYTRHRIKIFTKYFGLEHSREITSSPWIYGKITY